MRSKTVQRLLDEIPEEVKKFVDDYTQCIVDNKKIKSKNMNTKNKVYLVQYCGGNWDDYYTHHIFVTQDKDAADKYVEKFNTMLEKWTNYYKQFERYSTTGNWIADEYIEQHFNRWHGLNNITRCYYTEIEFR